jgi:hypothetical protein
MYATAYEEVDVADVVRLEDGHGGGRTGVEPRPDVASVVASLPGR